MRRNIQKSLWKILFNSVDTEFIFYFCFSHLRITVLTLACSLGLPECLTEVENIFTEWLAKDDFATNRPHPDLRSIIYSYGNEINSFFFIMKIN